MTVKELIDKLQKFDPSTEVLVSWDAYAAGDINAVDIRDCLDSYDTVKDAQSQGYPKHWVEIQGSQ